MTAATKDRDTREVIGRLRNFAVLANAIGFAGTMQAVTAAGYLTPGATSATLKCVGVLHQPYNNTGGANGAIGADVVVGIFGPFANSAAGDAIAVDDVGLDCYMVDDQTVALTNGGATRSRAGKIWHVDAEGVWVDFR